MGGGAFTDIGTHFVDTLLWLAGSPAAEVAAFTEKAGMPAESFINVQSRLANGVLIWKIFFRRTAVDDHGVRLAEIGGALAIDSGKIKHFKTLPITEDDYCFIKIMLSIAAPHEA